jgi:multidrug efflux system membrane fusion protein
MPSPHRLWLGTTTVPLAAAAACCLFLSGCVKPPEQAAAAPKPPVPVLAGMSVKRDVPIRVEAVGAAKALVIVMLKPEISGIIREKLFMVGPVKKGQLMYKLDARQYEATLKQAEARLAENQAKLAQNEALAANARSEADSKMTLYKKGAGTQYEADQAGRVGLATEALVRSTRAAIIADDAAISQAKLDIERCSIYSPIDGYTGPTLTDNGNVVKANETELIQLRQIVPTYLEVTVAQKYLTQVRTAMAKAEAETPGGRVPLEITVPDSPGSPPIAGELAFVNSSVNEDSGTITLRGISPNKDKRLWPGQYINIAIILGTRPGAVLVPSTAVQSSQKGTFIYVVKPDKSVEMRMVKASDAIGDQTVIESGLEPGLTVVTEGQLRLVPGATVTIKNEQDLSPTAAAPAAEAKPDAAQGAKP